MNVVEAKRTSFCITADSEDDVYEAIGELDLDFFENNANVKWVCSDYEPPIIDSVEPLTAKNKKHISCTVKQQKTIQKKFDSIIESFNKTENTDE